MNFFVFLIFSLSLLSLHLFFPSLSPTLSLYLSLSLSRSCLSIFLSPIPVVSLSYSHSCLPVYLSLTSISPSPSLWLSLFHPCLSSYLPLSHHVSLFLWFSLSLPRKKENIKLYCNVEKENL